MDLATRKRLYNLCRPEEPLAPDDPRCVDVDALPGNVRGGRWADALADRLLGSPRPVCALCTAQHGAGLTTELRRLAARLEDLSNQRWLVVHIDSAQVIDLASPVHAADLLLALLQRAEEAVTAATGAPAKEPLRRFRRWLDPAAPPGRWFAGEHPAESLRANPQARARFHAEVEPELSAFVNEVRSELVLLNEAARRAGHAGLVVLFDGLTRLTGLSTNFREVLDSVERAFLPGEPTTTLPIHVAWTVPSALLLRPRLVLHPLPLIALSEASGGRRAAGHAAGLEILRRRVPEATLSDLFGADSWAARVDQLLEASGGSPREMVALLQACLAAPSLDDAAFTRLLAQRRDPQQAAVSVSELPLLARIHQTRTLAPSDAAERAMAERLLTSGLVLRYQDDEPWYELSPALRSLPGVTAAR